MTTDLTLLQQRVLKVLERIGDQIREDPDVASDWAHCLDKELEYWAEADAFGTEGQNDPRGDQREGVWTTMDNVQGVDG